MLQLHTHDNRRRQISCNWHSSTRHTTIVVVVVAFEKTSANAHVSNGPTRLQKPSQNVGSSTQRFRLMQPTTRTTHSLAEAICFHYISHSALVMLSRHPWTPRSTAVQCQSVLLKNAKSLPRSCQRRNKKSSKLIEPYAMQQQQHRLPSSKPSSQPQPGKYTAKKFRVFKCC